MKKWVVALSLAIVAGCKTNQIAPVSGSIDGKPAITLYGSSMKATDYLFIDTVEADKKISYDGIVFTYSVAGSAGIYLVNTAGVVAAIGRLSMYNNQLLFQVTTTYDITFASPQYLSR